MRKPMFAVLAALVAGGVLSGCSTISYKYTFDPAASFAGARTYAWVTSLHAGPNAPLEDYVQFNADRVLEAKGWRKVSEQPELLFAMSFEQETYDGYQLRSLNLRAIRRDNGASVWRGTAFGSIDGSAASPDLKEAVNKILSSFPPK